MPMRATPSDAQFQLQDRAIDTIFLKPSWQLNPAIKVGVNGSYSFIDFKDSDRSDGQGLMVGPFIEWQISEYTNLYLEGGYQSLTFDHAAISITPISTSWVSARPTPRRCAVP